MVVSLNIRPKIPVRQIEPVGQDQYPSYLDSLLWWRSHWTVKEYWDLLTPDTHKPWYALRRGEIIRWFNQKLNSNELECPNCHGHLLITDNATNNRLWCFCWLADWIGEVMGDLYPYRSPLPYRDFASFKNRGDKSLDYALSQTRAFANFPFIWLILSGPYHVGKSHLAQAAAHDLGPIALYASLPDLQEKIFAALSDNTLPILIEKVKTAPILVLDDWGAEHPSDFVEAALMQIINYRYNMPEEFPTLVTTNLSRDWLDLDWHRLGARLIDNRFSFVEINKNLSDYIK